MPYRLPLLSFQGILTVFAIFLATYVIRRALAIRKTRRTLQGHPGQHVLWFTPLNPVAVLAARFFPPTGCIGNWYDGFLAYQKAGSTYLSTIAFSNAASIHWFSDAEAFKTISSKRLTFVKGEENYEFLNVYGPNIFTADGDKWKRYRSVARSAFSDGNNVVVWETTMRTIKKWFAEIDKSLAEGETTVDVGMGFTRLTMSVLLTAAFGRPDCWEESKDEAVPPGSSMTFKAAVISSLDYLMIKAVFPPWIFECSRKFYLPFLTPLLRKTNNIYDTLQAYLLTIIISVEDINDGGEHLPEMNGALLHNFVAANMAQNGDNNLRLTKQEVVSNIFLSLAAGHDSTANALCFAALFLAIYPDVQEAVLEEATKLWPDERSYNENNTPYSEGMASLKYTLAVLYETLRHYPAVRRLPKEVIVDTPLKFTRFIPPLDGEQIDELIEEEVIVKAGSTVVLDIYAMQMNPIYWGKDVGEFRPERFIDTETYRWPRDAFAAFMRGSRSCLGERFAITECLCGIARMVRLYEISIPDELKHMSLKDQKKKMLDFLLEPITTPAFSKVKLRRRF